MAQLVARLNGIQEVRGSNPLSSTNSKKANFDVKIKVRFLIIDKKYAPEEFLWEFPKVRFLFNS